MGRKRYKLTTKFDATAEKVGGFWGFWLNILKIVQLIFTKRMSFLDNHV